MSLQCGNPKCGHENRPIARFCAMCGEPIVGGGRKDEQAGNITDFDVPAKPYRGIPPIFAWRELRGGLSRQQVREILGEPASIKVDMFGEHWHYAQGYPLDHAYLLFGDSEYLSEWIEPDPAKTRQERKR